MALYVLDTDTVTYQQAGRATILRKLASLPIDAVCTTVITFREQMRGRLAVVDQATENHTLVQAYIQLQATFLYYQRIPILPFTPAALTILLDLRKQKLRIGTQDLRIAAIVLSYQATLVTSNRRDFIHVPGLIIEDWSI